MKEKGIKPELEVFDKGMIDIALKVDKQGLLTHPLHFDFVLGVQIAATLRDLVFLVGSIPHGSTWTACGIGRSAFEIAAGTIIMGGHVRIGLEDSVYIEKGVLAKGNGEMVEKVVKLARFFWKRDRDTGRGRERYCPSADPLYILIGRPGLREGLSVSFSAEIKNELAHSAVDKKCCTLAEIAGFIRACGVIRLSGGGKLELKISTENAAVGKTYQDPDQKLF